jgi:NADH-quinone oxidoreductase subunit G
MPKLTIDGKEIEVEDGLNLIEAASRIGVDIPHFCYHPALSVVAQCRQCLVEVEGVPKVMPACNTYVREGLIVKTDSERAVEARKATVEFTLINHPLDCPICDKGGECPLQMTTVSHGPGYSRFEGPEEKKVRQKYYLSDKILYDPNRCIMCTRCVRFTDEVTQTGELGYEGRGFRKKIVVFPGKNLDNELSGNVTDLCPVGALLNKDTLHEERVWYWKFTDTVCSLCSNGCNTTVGVDPRKGRVARVRPRTNNDVNDYWICDRGRYEWTEIQDADKRLKDPIIRRGEGFEITDWEEAITFASEKLTEISRESPETIAFLTSAALTNEELFLFKKLGEALGSSKIASSIGLINDKKKFGLLSSDPYPNSTGVKDLGYPYGSNRVSEVIQSIMAGEVKALYTAGIDVFDYVTNEDKPRLSDALSGLSLLVAQDVKLTETLRLAHVILPGASAYEKDGTFTNDRGRVQRVRKAITPPGTAKADWEIFSLVGRVIREELFSYKDPGAVMDAIAREYGAYGDISYDNIGMLGVNRSGPA